ncbi:hypothetical protein J7L13_00220 [bacterium]|nr:hypothetical protein [bacterium]
MFEDKKEKIVVLKYLGKNFHTYDICREEDYIFNDPEILGFCLMGFRKVVIEDELGEEGEYGNYLQIIIDKDETYIHDFRGDKNAR